MATSPETQRPPNRRSACPLTATASLIVGKWSAASRQNTLAAALKEWGRMRCTTHADRYLSDPI